MAGEIKAKLNFVDALGGTIASVVVPTPNQISEFSGGTYKDSTLVNAGGGANLFVCGSSICGVGGKYYSEYDGYLSNIVSATTQNSVGTYDTEFNMSVIGSNIKRITIIFDEIMQSFPTRISVNNIEYINDGTVFVWGSENGTNEVNITFIDWNKPNSLIRFTGLMAGLELVYDRGNGLKSLTASSQCQPNTADITFGVISQNASIEITDEDGQIVSFATSGLINSNVTACVYLDGKTIGVFGRTTGDGWDIDRNTNSVNINLTDKLQDWQEIGFTWGALQKNKDCYYVYERLVKFTAENTDIPYDDFIIDGAVKNLLQSLKVPYCYLEDDTLWNEWNKLCNACGLQVYQTYDGKVRTRRFV